MHFSRSCLLAVASALTAFAQNSFKIPPEGLLATAGKPFDIEWNPTTSGKITLILRSGSSTNLDEGEIIASGIDNSGSYTWTPKEDTPRGSDYAIQIVSDDDPSQVNYTPQFILDSTNTAPKSLTKVTLAAPSTSLMLSTAPVPSATASSVSTSSESSSHGKSTSTATGSSSSSPTAAQTSGSSSSTPSITPANASSAPSQAGALRATAMVGLLAAVALGAFAL